MAIDTSAGKHMFTQLRARRAVFPPLPDDPESAEWFYRDGFAARQLRAHSIARTEKSVIDFVSWFSGISRERIRPDTLLVQDLGIDGPDALEFLVAFSARYDVDISNFPVREYIHDEDRRRRFSLFSFLVRGRGFPLHDLKDLRMSDLVRAAEQKTLPARIDPDFAAPQ